MYNCVRVIWFHLKGKRLKIPVINIEYKNSYYLRQYYHFEKHA